MFRVVPSPIIRRAKNCIYSVWYLSHRYCYLPLSWKSWNWSECAVGGVGHLQHTPIPHAVDTVVCAPDDGWWYHPKHVEEFPNKINCITLHLVGYILEYSYDARTHKRPIPIILVRLKRNLNFLDRFSINIRKPNFMNIRSVGTELLHAESGDRRTNLTH